MIWLALIAFAFIIGVAVLILLAACEDDGKRGGYVGGQVEAMTAGPFIRIEGRWWIRWRGVWHRMPL